VPRPTPLTIASINVNGLRAASNNGMAGWWQQRRPDVVAMQEVRAPDDLVAGLVAGIAGDGWHVTHHECATKGRAGVAVASARPIVEQRCGLVAEGPGGFDDSGRWVEATIDTADGRGLTVASAYVHTGDADSPERMAEKLAFLDAMAARMTVLRDAGRHVLLMGDLNVGHRELDIKNWKGNLKKAGFLPEERAWFDRLFADGWVDVGRAAAGEMAGPYSWWSWRGKAFDVDSGWRIDYHIATTELAATATAVGVDRAPTYAERWSDHAPVVATYLL
jgi:exodeoxyribonuclease-3